MTVVDFGNIRVADKAARDRFRTALSVDDRAAVNTCDRAIIGMGTEYIDYACCQADKVLKHTDVACLSHTRSAHMSDKSADIVQTVHLVEIGDLGVFYLSVHHCAAEAARAAGIGSFCQCSALFFIVHADYHSIVYTVDLTVVNIGTERLENADFFGAD